MIGNPVLYYFSSKLFDQQLAIQYSQITQYERRLMKRFKLKFSFVNIIFYVCWMPNLVSSIILWFCWDTIPVKTILTTWTFMAVLNPLQAMFNAFVYRKWTRIAFVEPCIQLFRRKSREKPATFEKSPLLKDEPINYQTVESGSVDSVIEAPNTNNHHSVNVCSCV